MTRAATRLGLLVMAAGWGVAAAAPITSYYPYTTGTRWTYASGEVQQVGAARTVRGLGVTPLAHQISGKTVSEDLLEVQDSGIYLRGMMTGGKLSAWYQPPLLVYPAGPLLPGTTWSSASGKVKLTGRVMGQQALTTQSGSYNALVIRSDLTTAGGTGTQYQFFVPGVGVVRYATADGSTVDLLKP